ncbi:MAG: hypothetical protein AUH30_00360 [Candidatus Rokubacteria bacterium 13_1_40CM_68_15]|nr:MAG: hypothetical protein AUH30_00360 [Candidatus Rokubacteria bacterium 13_1_40CM_68_15]
MNAAVAVARRRWRRIVVCVVAVFFVYQTVIGTLLVLGLGGRPNFVRVYPVWENARRIVALTPAASDVIVLLSREPIVEYGRLHPQFGAAVWSFELTWSSLLFYVSFSALLGIALALHGGAAGWSGLGSLGGAGLVGLLGASVSSLTHCGLGSFGILLSIAGISSATIQWFGRLESVLIPAGYLLLVAAIVGRVRVAGRIREA